MTNLRTQHFEATPAEAAGSELLLVVGGIDATRTRRILKTDENGILQVEGTITEAEAEVTPHFKTLAATGSQTIPVGAKGWTVSVLTGTGTIGGETVPAGLSVGDSKTLLATIAVVMNNPGTAFVSWNT